MNLNFVSEQLLTPNNINHNDIFVLLEYISQRNLDYAEIYFQSSFQETWILDNKIVTHGTYDINQGVSVRTIKDEKSGFAYADQITLNALYQSAKIVRDITRKKGANKVRTLLPKINPLFYPNINPLKSLTREEKILLLKRVDKIARQENASVKEVNVRLSGVYEQVLIVATDGTLTADVRPFVSLSISVIVEDNGKRENGSSGSGARTGYEFFINNEDGEMRADFLAREAVRIALVNLSAVSTPAGTLPVVLGPGWPAVLLHEAVGHGLESDFNRRATSVFSNKIGKLVASELCTIVDDSTLNMKSGSLTVDDEGIPGQYNVLIENGVLKKYMQDKLNARLMDMDPTGNGRRESYAHVPMPRMTNTYMLPGKHSPQEIIDSVEYGLYAPNFSGGQVDITSGKFVFSTAEAYLIKNGKIGKALKGATLIGLGSEAMQEISMVGNNLKLDRGVGLCGKEGQNIPVCVGQPTLKIDKLIVGGTE